MGTRNLICVLKDEKYHVAQYGQWDGDFQGQGQGCVEFIIEDGNIEKLKNNLKKVRFFDVKGKDKEFLEAYDKNAPTWSNEPDNRTTEQIRWFDLYIHRSLGSDILSNIANSEDEEILLRDESSFAKDSLFCEYAYVVNLDSEELEVFEGFNKKELNEDERFYSEEKPEEYYPVKLVGKYKFSDLTKTTMKELEDSRSEEENDI